MITAILWGINQYDGYRHLRLRTYDVNTKPADQS